jgi:hypothetical protein
MHTVSGLPVKHLARTVRDLYFEPTFKEFLPRTIWSLSNAFPSALRNLTRFPNSKQLGSLLAAEFPRDSEDSHYLGVSRVRGAISWSA